VMQSHATIGAEIIGEHGEGMLALAREIALTHHEKYDGSGYPAGLAGDAIPLTGRIVAIADVFDALTSIRPYKRAWTEAEAIDHMVQQKGKHFDPALIDLFVAQLPAIRSVRERWAEAPAEQAAA
jgi:putative two-component system response regulator